MNNEIDMTYDSCEQVLSYICAQFGEDDNSERCLEVKKHLAGCPDCAAYCDSMEKMIALYRAASPQFPARAKDMIFESLGIKRS